MCLIISCRNRPRNMEIYCYFQLPISFYIPARLCNVMSLSQTPEHSNRKQILENNFWTRYTHRNHSMVLLWSLGIWMGNLPRRIPHHKYRTPLIDYHFWITIRSPHMRRQLVNTRFPLENLISRKPPKHHNSTAHFYLNSREFIYSLDILWR